jgi:SPP1 family predicted phage head-tail adaptor
MMQAGQLRHRVTFKRKVATQNTFSEEVPTWVTVATVWAAVEPLSGRELVSQQRTESLLTHRIRIRRRTDLDPTMRVHEGAHVYQVDSILDANKPGEMVLMCTEVVANG